MADVNTATIVTAITSGDYVFGTLSNGNAFRIDIDDLTDVIIGTNVTITDFDKLADITASATEVNVLDGFTGATVDLNILSGASAGGLTATELLYLNGTTSSVQTQLDSKATISSQRYKANSFTVNEVLGASDTKIAVSNSDLLTHIGLSDSTHYVPRNTIIIEVWKQTSATVATIDKSADPEVTSAVIGATSTYEVTNIEIKSLTSSTTYDVYITFDAEARP